MRRSPLSLADLAVAVRELHASPDGVRGIAALLGLTLAVPVQALAPQPLPRKDDDEIFDESDSANDRRHLHKQNDDSDQPNVQQAIHLRQLSRPATELCMSKTMRTAAPLPIEPGALPSVEQLLPLRPLHHLRAFLRDVAGQPCASRELDIDAIVAQLARHRLQMPLPHRLRVGLRGGVQAVIQVGTAMQPFHHDMQMLRQALRRVLGSNLLEERFFEETLPWGSKTSQTSRYVYNPPPSGTTVLLITDLGLGHPLGHRWITQETWIAHARRLRALGCQVTAIVPYGPSRWPRELRRWIALYPWEVPTATMSTTPLTLDDLKRSLAMAAYIDPVLLRAARRHFLPQAEPGMEADLLLDPDIGTSNVSLSTFVSEHVRVLREQLRQDSVRLHAAWTFLRAHRLQCNANALIQLEEELVYQTLQQTSTATRALRMTLTRLARTLFEGGKNGLARWVTRCLPELPEWVRLLPEARNLQVIATTILGGIVTADPSQTFTIPLPESVDVGVVWHEGQISLHEPPHPGDAVMQVPGTRPRVVFIDEPGKERRALTLSPQGYAALDGVALPCELHLLSGALYAMDAINASRPPILEIQRISPDAGRLGRLTWSPDGRYLAIPASNGALQIWDVEQSTLDTTYKGHSKAIFCAAWSHDMSQMALGSDHHTIRLWNRDESRETIASQHNAPVAALAWSANDRYLAVVVDDGEMWVQQMDREQPPWVQYAHENGWAGDIAWSPDGQHFATCGRDGYIRVWDVATRTRTFEWEAHEGCAVYGLAWSIHGLLASGGGDHAVRLWRLREGNAEPISVLEGHTSRVLRVTFSADGALLASRAESIHIWHVETQERVGFISLKRSRYWAVGLAFHPTELRLAAVTDLGEKRGQLSRAVSIWTLDPSQLQPCLQETVRVVTAKVVLLGAAGAGKTTLAYRLASHSEPDVQKVKGLNRWILTNVGKRVSDGAICEVLLQEERTPYDARLPETFAKTDMVILMRSMAMPVTKYQEDESTVKMIETTLRCPIIIVEHGSLSAFLQQSNLPVSYHADGDENHPHIAVNAQTGEGIDKLQRLIYDAIDWKRKAPTSTTSTLRNITERLLAWKWSEQVDTLYTLAELRKRLQATDETWSFADGDINTVLFHLANTGFVRLLYTSRNEMHALLNPARIDQLVSHLLLMASSDGKDPFTLDEQQLYHNLNYLWIQRIPNHRHQMLLLNAAIDSILMRNWGYRIFDFTQDRLCLVISDWPASAKRTYSEETALQELAMLRIDDNIAEVFAPLVVLLGNTPAFSRTQTWQDEFVFTDIDGKEYRLVPRFPGQSGNRQDLIVLCQEAASDQSRLLFLGILKALLAHLHASRHQIILLLCVKCGATLSEILPDTQYAERQEVIVCHQCKTIQPYTEFFFPPELQRRIFAECRAAQRRACFERALFTVNTALIEDERNPVTIFISYAWDDASHDRWVTSTLAMDLARAGITVLLDHWNLHNEGDISSFIERIHTCDRILVVGTPAYLEKASAGDSFGVAKEVAHIFQRFTESKTAVTLLLRAGDPQSAFPKELHGVQQIDLRDPVCYDETILTVILDLLGFSVSDPISLEMRRMLKNVPAIDPDGIFFAPM